MIKPLNHAYKEQFITYVKMHKGDFDDYFVSDDVLEKYSFEENLTYVLLDQETITGAISVMRAYGVRLRFFHVTSGSFEDYLSLHQCVLEDLRGKHYKVFLPAYQTVQTEMYLKLGHSIERKIFSLMRDPAPINVPVIHTDYAIREMSFPEDLEAYCHVRNEAFKDLVGSSPITPDDIKDLHQKEEYIKETTLVLTHHDLVVGIIKGAKEIENGITQVYIGPVALLNAYQGLGLGNFMLCYLINTVQELGPWRCQLSVNATNKHATKLYLNNGFYVDEEVIALI